MFFLAAIILYTGISVLIQGYTTNKYLQEFEEKSLETTARVDRIVVNSDGSKDIYVTYWIDDMEYSNVNIGYETTAIEGYGIYIYYDKNNPGKVLYNEKEGMGGPTLYIVGVVCIFVSAALVCLVLLLENHRKSTSVQFIPEMMDLKWKHLKRIPLIPRCMIRTWKIIDKFL